MGKYLLTLILLPACAWGAEELSQADARRLIEGYAQCYAYYNMSHFFWGSRNDRLRTRFYLEHTELAYVYASQLGEIHGVNPSVFDNSSLSHRNIMMSEINQDLNQIAALSRSYEGKCEEQMARIPADVVEHYEEIKHDLRIEPQI